MTLSETEMPITPEEHELLVYRRKAKVPTKGTPEEEPFKALLRRFHAQFPPTPERVGWHEAGHAVVAHRLGYRVSMIERDATWTGNPRTYIEPPPQGSDHWALVQVAGYLAEDRAVGNVDPEEACEVAEMAEQRHGYGPSDRRAFVEAVEKLSLAILVSDWSAVEQVAKLVQAKPDVLMAELDGALSGVSFGSA